jgi:hypothetical protein
MVRSAKRPQERAPQDEGQAAELTLAWRLCVDRKRVHGTGELARERRIYHAVTLDAALPLEGLRHNIHTEVRLAAWPVAGMPLMKMGLVLDLEAFGKESFAQLVCDNLPGRHVAALILRPLFVNAEVGVKRFRNVKT